MIGKVVEFLPTDPNNPHDRVKLQLEDGSSKAVPLSRCADAIRLLFDARAVLPVTVEYDSGKGQVKDVRLPGEQVVRRLPPPVRPAPAPYSGEKEAIAPVGPAKPGLFHNPYGFVPFVDRPTEGAFAATGLHMPLDRMRPGTWSGTLRIRWTAATPILVPDPSRATVENDHSTFPVRVDHRGHAYMSATSIKGVVRSAMEAITASRMGVADEASSEDRVGYRRTTNEAVRRAVRLERGRDGQLWARLLNNARLPFALAALAPQGAERWVTLRDGKAGPIVQGLFEESRPGAARGWVMRTGRSIDTKRHERFLYDAGKLLPLDPLVEREWRELMAESRQSMGATPPGEEWPAHLSGHAPPVLDEGLLAWAVVENEVVVKLLPSMISRDLHPLSPADVLPAEHRSAIRESELSFADRLFGWVGMEGDEPIRQVRGRVRFASAVATTEAETFPAPVPLQILSTPKPQQGRFYLGRRDESGVVRPVPRGASRVQAGYRPGNTQRGFKVYLHHRSRSGEAAYWRHDANPLSTEWKRPMPTEGSNRDDQNRSLAGWVAIGTQFEFDVQVEALTTVELGALCRILDLSRDGHHHLRVGGGKPLGFGSVRSEIVSAALEPFEDVHARWTCWGPSTPERAADRHFVDQSIEEFDRELRTAFGSEPPQLVAFLRACAGDELLPVHYPRTTSLPDRDGKTYEWFVENDRVGKVGPVNGYSLPDLAGGDTGLDGLPRLG